MKFILLVLLTALWVLFLNPFIPYWGVMIGIALLSSVMAIKPFSGFLGGGLGMGLAWLGQSVYIGIVTGSSLPDKMAGIMEFGSGMTLVAITATLGLLLGGFSGWSGALFRKLIQQKETNIYRG